MHRSGALIALVILLLAGLLAWRLFHEERSPDSLRGSGRGGDDGALYTSFQTEVMATRLEVTLPAADGTAEAAQAVFRIFRDADARLNEWKESSPLSAVNRAAGAEPVPVPEDLLRVLRRALEIAALTDGAFDPTWAALWGLWDFRAADPQASVKRIPDAEEIARRTALVDWTKVELDEEAGTARLAEPGMVLGLGGIAKGWALDRAAEELRRRGIESFLLQIGGQVLAGGRRRTAEGSRPWQVGIRDPRGVADDFFARVPVTDGSLSTSGDYESFFVVGGVRYHHILDPRTGWPARGLRSATVISPEATRADALSTALMVMGKEKGLALAEELPEVEAVLVDAEGEIVTTSGMTDRLELRHRPRHP